MGAAAYPSAHAPPSAPLLELPPSAGGVMARRTIAEAAERLGLSPKTLRNQVAAGRLRVTRQGRDNMVTDAEIERYRLESLGRRGRPLGSRDRRPRSSARLGSASGSARLGSD